MKNFKTKLGLIAISVFMLALMTTNRASAQFGLTNPIFDVQYNNQFDVKNPNNDFFLEGAFSNDYTTGGAFSGHANVNWLVDTVAPYGSFVSNYMGAINSFTANNGFAMLDLDAQPTNSGEQIASLKCNDLIQITGHDNYGIAFQSYYGRYDSTDEVYVRVIAYDTINLDANGDWTYSVVSYQLHSDLAVASIEDSIHYIDLSGQVKSGDIIDIRFDALSSWGLAWMIDDLVVLAWNPTQVVSGIGDCINCDIKGFKTVTNIYNLLGQPVTEMKRGHAYIRMFDDGTTDKISVR